jgi:hypothetical protein
MLSRLDGNTKADLAQDSAPDLPSTSADNSALSLPLSRLSQGESSLCQDYEDEEITEQTSNRPYPETATTFAAGQLLCRPVTRAVPYPTRDSGKISEILVV